MKISQKVADVLKLMAAAIATGVGFITEKRPNCQIHGMAMFWRDEVMYPTMDDYGCWVCLKCETEAGA